MSELKHTARKIKTVKTKTTTTKKKKKKNKWQYLQKTIWE